RVRGTVSISTDGDGWLPTALAVAGDAPVVAAEWKRVGANGVAPTFAGCWDGGTGRELWRMASGFSNLGLTPRRATLVARTWGGPGGHDLLRLYDTQSGRSLATAGLRGANPGCSTDWALLSPDGRTAAALIDVTDPDPVTRALATVGLTSAARYGR